MKRFIGLVALVAALPTLAFAQDPERVEQARRDLFVIADAKPDQIEKVKTFCRGMDLAVQDRLKWDKDAEGVVQNCKALGYL